MGTWMIMTHPNLFKPRKIDSISAKSNNAFRNYILAWISILVLGTISGIWIWLATLMFKILPHSFAWEMLLRTFGLSFSLDCSEAGIMGKDSTNWPPVDNNCIPISHSIPCIPVISLMILFVSMACGIVSLLPVSLANLDAAAYGVRVSLTWHLCFLTISLIVVGYFYNVDSGSLRPVMLAALAGSNTTVSEMWNITQISNQCCGIDSYKDWTFPDGLYPASCCSNETFTATSPCTAEKVWPEIGCLRKEEITVEIYGTLVFFLLCFQFTVNIYLLYLVEGLKSVWFSVTHHDQDRREFIELGAPLLK